MTNSDLLAGDKDESKVEIAMYEYNSSGKHKNIGKFYFNYGELKSASSLQPTCAKGKLFVSNIVVHKK